MPGSGPGYYQAEKDLMNERGTPDLVRYGAGREIARIPGGGVGLDERIAVQVEWTPEEGLAHSLAEGGSVFVKVQLS